MSSWIYSPSHRAGQCRASAANPQTLPAHVHGLATGIHKTSGLEGNIIIRFRQVRCIHVGGGKLPF
jgi:hypothetical protein